MRDDTKKFPGSPSIPSGGSVPGSPSIPSGGSVVVFLQAGHITELPLLLSLELHSLRQIRQNVCKHCKALGSFTVSLQIPHFVRSSGAIGGLEVAIVYTGKSRKCFIKYI